MRANALQRLQTKNSVLIGIFLLVVAISALYGPFLTELPRLEVAEAADYAIEKINTFLDPFFDTIKSIIRAVFVPVHTLFSALSPLIVMTFMVLVGYSKRNWALAIFGALGFLFIATMGYWAETMTTLSLVATAVFFSLVIGIPLGILKAHSRIMTLVLDPLLDIMQTTPLFVYLIPVVMFFNIGNTAGIVATFIFATPPAVRLTSLGITQISEDIVEAGRSFGTSFWQFLFKIELPLAMPSIIVGINQTIMLALSMVIVAALVGTEGLGGAVVDGVTRGQVGIGIAGGIGVIILAMTLDRLTKQMWHEPT